MGDDSYDYAHYWWTIVIESLRAGHPPAEGINVANAALEAFKTTLKGETE